MVHHRKDNLRYVAGGPCQGCRNGSYRPIELYNPAGEGYYIIYTSGPGECITQVGLYFRDKVTDVSLAEYV